MAAKEKTNFPIEKRSLRKRIHIEMTQNWDLYLLILPVLAYFIIFCYYPMYGAQIAFRDYRPTRGIAGSEWVGLEHFINQMSSAQQNVATDSTMTEMLLAAESIKYAAIIVASLPVLVVYPFVQRYMISGITVGAIKG